MNDMERQTVYLESALKDVDHALIAAALHDIAKALSMPKGELLRHYIALVRKDAASDYGVSFPDLPGCVTAGSTLDGARTFAEEVLALHLAGLAEDGEVLPEPSSMESIMGDPESWDGVAILVQFKSAA